MALDFVAANSNFIEINFTDADHNFSNHASVGFWYRGSSGDDSAMAAYALTEGTAANGAHFQIFLGDGATANLTDELITVFHRASDGGTAYEVGYTTPTRTELFDGNWHHILVVCNTVDTAIYLDGISRTVTTGTGTDTGSYSCTTPTHLRIGGRRLDSSDSLFGRGEFADVRLFPAALSPEEASAFYNGVPAGKARSHADGDNGGYWPLLIDAQDYTNNQNDGTLQGSPAITQTTHAPISHFVADSVQTKFASFEQLIHHWRLNDSEGTSAFKDSVGTEDMTVNGTPVFKVPTRRETNTNDPNPTAVDFDGSTDYGETATNLDFPLVEFTLSAYIKPRDISTSNADPDSILAKWKNDTNNRQLQWFIYNNTISTWTSSDGSDFAQADSDGDANIDTDTWYHVVLAADLSLGSDKYIYYVDGVEHGRNSPSTFSTMSTQAIGMRIGSSELNSGSERFFDGKIDDVRIYDRKLSATEVAALNGLRPELIHHWTLDDIDNSFVDIVGSENMSEVGTVTPTEALTFSSGGSQLFDGSTGYLVTSGGPDITSNKFTISAYINIKDSGLNPIISKWHNSSNDRSFLFYINDNRLIFGVSDDGTTGGQTIYQSPASSIANDTTYHVVGIYDKGVFSLYIDGVSQSTSLRFGSQGNALLSSESNAREIRIGSIEGLTDVESGEHFCNGTIDDVRIYEGLLDQSAISALAADKDKTGEISVPHTTVNDNVYAIIRNSSQKVWNPTGLSFTDYVSSDVSEYALTTQEQGAASAIYTLDFPSDVPAGVYSITFYAEAGSAPGEGDTFVEYVRDFYWDGTARVPFSSIEPRLPAALVGGKMSADVLSINASTAAANSLERVMETSFTGSVDDSTFTPTTTVFETDLTEASDDHFNGQFIRWGTGAANAGLTFEITDSEGTTTNTNNKVKLTTTTMPNAPANADTFIIIGSKV